MKKLILILTTIFVAGAAAFANDISFFRTDGTLLPAVKEDCTVEMKSEEISIVMEEEYFEQTFEFDFFNNGDTCTLDVGFPYFDSAIKNENVYDFACWTDGKKSNYSDYSKDGQYVRKITFPNNGNTKIKLYFKSRHDYVPYVPRIDKFFYNKELRRLDSMGMITYNLKNKIRGIDSKVEEYRTGDNMWQFVLYQGLPIKRIIRYDCNGNKIYENCPEIASEDFFKYNSKNQLVKQENKKLKSSVENKYHSNGKIAYRKKINGNRKEEIWFDKNGYGIKKISFNGKKSKTVNEYNQEGKIVHRKRADGNYEEWYEYTESGYSRHGKEYSTEWWESYDAHNNKIYAKMIIGEKTEEEHFVYEYDENGKIIHYKNVESGSEYWSEYDEKGQLVYEKSAVRADGKIVPGQFKETWQEFNADGKCIHTKSSDGTELFFEYDSNGNEIYFKAGDGRERRTVYEYYSNGKIKEAKVFE